MATFTLLCLSMPACSKLHGGNRVSLFNGINFVSLFTCLPKVQDSGLTPPPPVPCPLGLGPLVFRMLHCFGGTYTGVEREMETHFMLAVPSWWEISGVRPVFVGESGVRRHTKVE